MSHPRLTKTTALAIAAMLGVNASAHAIEIANSVNRAPLVRQDSGTELPNLENRLQRQQFQQQQQQFRAQDRDMVPQLPRPEVPRIGPNCRLQVFANSFVTNCR